MIPEPQQRIGRGDGVEIIPTYDDDGYRTHVDDVTYCAGEVLSIRPDGDAHLRLFDGREVWVTVRRLRRCRL